jgi:hypothetical protein
MDNVCDEVLFTSEMDQHMPEITLWLDVPVPSLKDWCLHLCLLYFGIVETLRIGPSPSEVMLHLSVLRSETQPPTRGCYSTEEGAIQMKVPPSQLQHWICFFIGYLHESKGAADWSIPCHVDIEFDPCSSGGRLLCMAISVHLLGQL